MNKKAIITIIALGLAMSLQASQGFFSREQMTAKDHDLEKNKELLTPSRSSDTRYIFRHSDESVVEVPYKEYKKMAEIVRKIENTRKQLFAPKPLPIVLASFEENEPVKLSIMMPSYYYKYPSDFQGTEMLKERREIALEEKLISDEIDAEHVIVTVGEIYGFEKTDKALFLMHPRFKRESTRQWLQRLRDIRFADTNSASSSNTMSTNSEEDSGQRISFEELSMEIEYPTIARVDMPDSEELILSFQGIEANSDVASNVHDTIPNVSSDSVVPSEEVVQTSVKDQLMAFKEKFDEESPSMFSTKTKVAAGLAATLAYGYFCYARSQVVRTKK